MYNPDDDKPKGSVQAASSPSAAKTTLQQGVFVLDSKSGKLRSRFVPVTTGITGTTDIEALTGLKAGDEIVIGPYKTLRSLKNSALVKRDTVKPAAPGSSGS
jgi:HlyD family secretion protein